MEIEQGILWGCSIGPLCSWKMESNLVIFLYILVWVFDGKPPDLKKAELMRRKKVILFLEIIWNFCDIIIIVLA